MSKPRASIYRDALQVSRERIARMSDEDLNVLMGQLLRAQAYKCGSPLNEICVNTEGHAKDNGSDAWSGAPSTPDVWLGSTRTCWQFKAGSAGQPNKLAGEATKSIPKETLTSGGRFVVVASGSTSGESGERNRLSRLTTEAQEKGIPTSAIEVIGSERLTEWCNQNPAIAAYWAGYPDGLWTFDEWSRSDEHQVPWQATASVQLDLEARRSELDCVTGSVQHLHIYGPPGVGKSRLALELCREAAWSSTVVYIRQASDVRLTELIDVAARTPGVLLTVVADEVQADQLRPLRDSVGRGSGRIRLITVGLTRTPDPTRIPALLVKPMDRHVMEEVVKGWYPALPLEHVEFVVRFADGYVRLARLAANAVVQHPTMDVHGLLSQAEIRGFLDGMLGEGDRSALYVVAVLDTVGWSDDRQDEGEAIARHLGLDWNRVRESVESFHRAHVIAPRGGRYRYISPTPLGIHLAVEAWNTYPELLRSLPGALPSEAARDAYYKRLQAIASNPQTRAYAREELRFFFRLDDFLDARAVRRWSALSAADPFEAARNIARIIGDASVEERNRIKGRARREIVWTLARLAWKRSSFRDAVLAMALLAEAENETWANNATAEFVARFQILLSGTAVPYLDRLSVLDELLMQGRPSLASLAVTALAQVGNSEAFGTGSDPASDELPEREWKPDTESDHYECVEAAINRLCDIASRGTPGIQADLVRAAENLSSMLRNSAMRELVARLIDAVHATYPEAREPLRRAIAEIINSERQYWKELSADELAELETLHARYEDPSLKAQLQQRVGRLSQDWEDQHDLRPLAQALLSGPGVLAKHWPWLTSGEAADALRLGEALAAVDPDGGLAETLPSLPDAGSDSRLVCGYVSARRRVLGDEWYDAWVTSQYHREPRPIGLLFAVSWRCGVTPSVARLVAAILRRDQVSAQIVGQLEFGRWNDVPADVLATVLRAMVDTGHHETAVAILAHRMKADASKTECWEPLALELVTASTLIRSGNITSAYWEDVATFLVADHPKEIAAAILREQADRESGTWFIEFSKASRVLQACVQQDPRGVWQSILPHLSSPAGTSMFSIGFPRSVLEHIPPRDVVEWIAAQPEERAAMVARLTGKDLSTDDTLASRIIGEYGDNERVASAFLSQFMSGSSYGPASSKWERLAQSLDSVAARTALPQLSRWASQSAISLRKMAERDRQREEEDEIRGR